MDEPSARTPAPPDLAQASLELEDRIRAVMASRRVDEALARSHSAPRILPDVFSIIVEEVGASTCALLLRNAETGELFVKGARGGGPADLLICHIPSASPYREEEGGGPFGAVLREGQAVYLADEASADLAASIPAWSREAGPAFCLPLFWEGSPRGVLAVGSPATHRFSRSDEALLSAMAARLAASPSDLLAMEDEQAVDTALQAEVGKATAEQRRLNEELQAELTQSRRVEVELLRREQDLRAQTLTLQELVAHLPYGVCLIDADHAVVAANALAYAHLEALTTRRPAPGDAIHRIGSSGIEDIYQTSQEGSSVEVILDGPPRRVFEVSARPITQGVMEGNGVLLIHDVTAERAAQDRSRQQDRLAAVGQLAAGIAHDLNNVLTPVIGYAELLRTGDAVSAEVKEDLDQIISQGERGAQMIRQILDFTRLSGGQRYPLGMGPFVKEAMRVLGRTLPETIHMSVEVADEDLPVDGDPTQLQQVLTNLVVNARDAMPEGGSLRVDLAPLTVLKRTMALDLKAGEWIQWSVSDTGTGIEADHRGHIFEPFFTTKEEGRGTGLGLSQVYGIIQEHGGSIEVQSSPGAGTTFRIYLPRLQERAASPPARAGLPERGEGETVLVVEDQDSVRDLTRAMLETLGYTVLTAGNGRRALEQYESQLSQVDVVLTDAVMPEMGGWELIAALRERDPHMRAVLMTGYPLRDEQEPRAAGRPVAVVDKPVSMERLARALREELGRPEGGETTRH